MVLETSVKFGFLQPYQNLYKGTKPIDQGVEQGHVYHKLSLIIIILKVAIVLLPFDNDILYTDDCIITDV